MAQVSSPNPAGVYHEGRANRVLSIADVKAIMVRYVDHEGKEAVALAYVFGEADYKGLKDAVTGKTRRMAGVWIVANLAQLQNTMKLAPGPTALEIITRMEERGLMQDGKIVSGAPVEVELPDVSGVFSEISEDDKTGE